MIENKYGLIGYPVTDSLSPSLFSAGYADRFRYDLIEAQDFESAYKKFFEGYQGVNVTSPFKQDAFRRADVYTEISRRIGAANILYKKDGLVCADNSDFSGIILSVADAVLPGLVTEFYSVYGIEAYMKIHQYFRQSIGTLYEREPQALIVGCGGAGRAAAVAAAELGFSVVLMNRTEEKARILAAELPDYGFIVDPITDFRAAFKECDLVIYTLPGKIEAADMLDVEDFQGEDRYEYSRPAKILLEANYKNPAFSGDLLSKSDAGGCQYVSGKKWLMYQAVTGYSALTGTFPDFAAMSAVLK